MTSHRSHSFLVVRTKSGSATVALKTAVTVIGRAPNCAVKIFEESASREHCAIEEAADGYILRDLGSRNGTLVNGLRVGQAKLNWGDRIQIGDTQILFMSESVPGETLVRRSRTTHRQDDEQTETIILKASDLDPAMVFESRNQHAYIAALYESATKLSSIKDPFGVMQALHEIVTRHFAIKHCAVWLADPRTGQVTECFPPGSIRPDVALVLEAIQEQEIILSRTRQPAGVLGSVYAPLRGSTGGFGIIVLDNREAEIDFLDQDLNALGIVGYLGGLHLENLQYLKRLEAEKGSLERELYAESEIVGSPQTLSLIDEFVKRAAPTNAAVLVRGPSGVGKELVARQIHRASLRKSRPFVALNCSAIPRDSLESELFGHEKGAFTGATAQHKGLFETAEGGTLLLEDIGESSLQSQAKFLRAIENRTFCRVGGTIELTSDVRLIAATTRDLREEVSAGRFREDLYYRINVLELVIPSLRDRPQDISILAKHWLQRLCEKNGKRIDGFEREAMVVLERYPWPGNVRELKNAVERAVIFSTSAVLTATDFPTLQQRASKK